MNSHLGSFPWTSTATQVYSRSRGTEKRVVFFYRARKYVPGSILTREWSDQKIKAVMDKSIISVLFSFSHYLDEKVSITLYSCSTNNCCWNITSLFDIFSIYRRRHHISFLFSFTFPTSILYRDSISSQLIDSYRFYLLVFIFSGFI